MIMQPADTAARQDTVPVIKIQQEAPAKLRSDSLLLSADPLHIGSARLKLDTLQVADTTTICFRNSISDVTFYDSTNLLTIIYPYHQDQFPELFTAKNKVIQEEARTELLKHLRAGSESPVIPLHEDWFILVILISAFLFGLIRRSSLDVLHSIERFFLFRSIGEPSARDTGSLFNWDSTIMNLLSFLTLGLFAYTAANLNDAVPAGFPGILIWLVLVIAIIAVVTMKHLVCLITGYISDERDLFAEYIISIYQFYRFSAILIFVATVLIIYTTIVPAIVYLNAGLVAIAALYLIRVLRLLLIFLNRNISLFYFLLYLCALEILPVVISVKYISGFV